MEAFEFSDDVQKQIEQFEKKLEGVQAEIIKYSIKKQEPVFAERDEVLSKVDGFWRKALENCGAVAVYIDDQDHDVFQSLQKVRVERNQEDPRESTVHFDFGENEYFSDKTLTKVFKVTADAEPLGSDDFDFAGSVTTESVKINWKSEEKNLAKKNPSTIENEDELNPGSFFSSLFETDNVQLAATIGDNIINEFYPRAIDYYTGKAEEDYSMYDSFDGDEDDEDDDEEDEEDDDDDDREIDLEAEDDRPSKKSKNWTVS